MHRIAIAGLSIHRTDVSGLESVRRPDDQQRSAFLRDLADALGASELVLLSTCNRVEVIYAREEGDAPDGDDLPALARALCVEQDDGADLAARLALRTGREAIHHLFRVAASLDSLVLGEDQIIAQVREAYGRSADIGLVGTLLSPLFHAALQIGKKVRSETELAQHPLSVVNLAVARLANRAGQHPALAVLGAGEMGALLTRALGAAGLPPSVIANRTRERAVVLAGELRCAAVSLDDFVAGVVPVDVIVSATSAPGTILSAERLSALAAVAPAGRGLTAIDLAVPRDIAACDDADVSVICLDDLRAEADANRALRAEAAAVAEQMVDAKLERYVRRFHEELAAPAVACLRQESSQLLERELNGLLGGRLSHLAEGDRRVLERWARSTFGRLLHLPVSALKRMAADTNGHDPTETEDAQ